MTSNQHNSAQRKPLHGMFTDIPPHYDLINCLITFGMDKHWRWKTARECLAFRPEKVLDLCCGTGDLAINIALLAGENVEIAGLDYSKPMLDIASKKAEQLVGKNRISFVHGDAAAIHFPDGYFDVVGISFAFRNLTYKNPQAERHIAEVLRVLRTSGKFVIVESSQPESKLIRQLFHLYLRWYVRRIGQLLSGNRGAYYYLAESAARFYNPDELRKLLISAGFREVSFLTLFSGTAAIYVAIK
ncbi:ubiquinone/menaquinone biosynthesis methyltransferase [Chloroflexota bacterium]